MNQARKLIAAFDNAYAADHYAAEKILKELQHLYKNTSNQWIKSQIRLRQITIGQAFKRNNEKDLFDPELLAYFEKNELKYETAAILLSRINFLLNKGNVELAEKYLLEVYNKNLSDVTSVVSFVYRAHWANVYGKKHEHAQRLSVCLEAFQKLESITQRDGEWHRFFLLFSSILIDIYVSNEEFELASPYIAPALKICEEQQVNWTHKTYIRTSIAEYYAALKDYPNALKHYQIAKKSINSNDYSFVFLNTCNSLLRKYFLWYDTIPASHKKKREKLLKEIEQGILEIENHKDREEIPLLKIVIPTNNAKLALLKGDYEYAIEKLNEALQFIDIMHVNIHHYYERNYRLQYNAYHQLWLQTKDPSKLERAYYFLQKVHEIVESQSKEKVKNRLDAVRGYYELQQKKLNEQLLQQKLEAMNKELQMANLNLHEKVMVLDDLKKYTDSLKKKEPESKQVINAINQKIDAVKITEQEKALLQQKMNESDKLLAKELSKKYTNLSPHEIRMCTFFQTGITDKELVKLYGQTERAYRQQRYRIKKKMNLSAQENLVKHLSNLVPHI